MQYPAEILASLQKVEATRSARIGQSFPRMTPDQRQDVLHQFHPDYIQNAFHELKVGPNKGWPPSWRPARA